MTAPDSQDEHKKARLVGWKAISAHLDVSVRTAQRWERTLGLPVDRVRTPTGEVISSDADDLTRWLEQSAVIRTTDAQACEGDGIGAADNPKSDTASTPLVRTSAAYSTTALVGVCVCSALLSGVLTLAVARASHSRLPSAAPIVPSGSPPSKIVGDARGQLVGRLVMDENRNGEWDADERFIAQTGRTCHNAETVDGFVVSWSGESQGSSAATNCNPEPFYHGRLRPGRYRARLTSPPGWRITSADEAQIDIESGRDTHVWFAVQRVQ